MPQFQKGHAPLPGVGRPAGGKNIQTRIRELLDAGKPEEARLVLQVQFRRAIGDLRPLENGQTYKPDPEKADTAAAALWLKYIAGEPAKNVNIAMDSDAAFIIPVEIVGKYGSSEIADDGGKSADPLPVAERPDL